VLRGCCAINRIAVKGVRTPPFKGCGTRLHTCRGEGRYGALQGGGATTGSVALRALPCAGVGVDARGEAFESNTVLENFSAGGLYVRLRWRVERQRQGRWGVGVQLTRHRFRA
jgi:hypothetical protein